MMILVEQQNYQESPLPLVCILPDFIYSFICSNRRRQPSGSSLSSLGPPSSHSPSPVPPPASPLPSSPKISRQGANNAAIPAGAGADKNNATNNEVIFLTPFWGNAFRGSTFFRIANFISTFFEIYRYYIFYRHDS